MADNRVKVRFKDDVIIEEHTAVRTRADGGTLSKGQIPEKSWLTVAGAHVEATKDGQYLVHPDRAERFERDGLLASEDSANRGSAVGRRTAGETVDDDTDVAADERDGSIKNPARDAGPGQRSGGYRREDAAFNAQERQRRKENREEPADDESSRSAGTAAESSGRRPSDVGKTRQQLRRQANAGGHSAGKTGGTTRAERRKREKDVGPDDE
jgi:hypothetical protein